MNIRMFVKHPRIQSPLSGVTGVDMITVGVGDERANMSKSKSYDNEMSTSLLQEGTSNYFSADK